MDYRRILLFIVAGIPTVQLMFHNDPVNPSGQWALLFLLLTTSITVLQKIFKIPAVKYRRQLGLWSMWYVFLHVSNYLLEGGITKALTEVTYDYQLIGWVTLAFLLALTITSTKKAQQKLRDNWSKLHMLMYPVIGMALIHGVIATKLGWFTMYPFAIAIAIIIMRKKVSSRLLVVFGMMVAYGLAGLPNYSPPVTEDFSIQDDKEKVVEPEVVQPKIGDHIVSISCVNGKELIYLANGEREWEKPCSDDLTKYYVRDKGSFNQGLVDSGVYNYEEEE